MPYHKALCEKRRSSHNSCFLEPKNVPFSCCKEHFISIVDDINLISLSPRRPNPS